MAPDTLSLAGKVAIITGSGRENGIGAAIALALARNGASVVINYVSESSAPRAVKVADKAKDLGAKAVVNQADASTQEGATKLVQETLAGFQTDKIDILVNNAGHGAAQGKTFNELTADEVQSAFVLNTFSTLYVIQAAAKYMRRGGRIVNIGSIVSRMRNLPGVSIYGASKAAQEYLTGAIATELGPNTGITVNTVAPGPIAETDAGSWFPNNDVKPVAFQRMEAETRLGKLAGNVDDVADAVLLLVSDHARWITGQYIAVSGGVTE
ncbi:hypothetical protein V8F06_013274 [Rhypophila decipiens]